MKLGTLVYHVTSDFLVFAWGLSYGLSNSKKWGKIIKKF